VCGIVGYFHPDRIEPPPGLLAAMASSVRHRGPDDEGFFHAPGVGLGFRRLSIVDLATGNQPMFSTDGRVVAICNGEIYNHRDLRARLARRGHRFQTQADTEVVPALYRDAGLDFALALEGQFAAAVFDQDARRLVLARDRMGIAPLFWAMADGALLFASEIKALLRHPALPRMVDLTGLDQVLTFPGLVSPYTMFAGVHALGPGQMLVFEGGTPVVSKYWDLDYPTAPVPERDERDLVAELEAVLRRAVRRHMQSDVPVGAYLSGGLDSALIAAIAVQESGGELRETFSIGFDDPAIDERRFQHMMATRLGTTHHEREVRPAHIMDRLEDIVMLAEAPLRESYNACSLILSGMVHDAGLKVVLTGEGADELFGGYVGYRLDRCRVDSPDPGDLEAQLEAETRERLWGDPGLFYEREYHAHTETKLALYSDAVAERFDEFDCLARSPVDVGRVVGRAPSHQRSYLDVKLRLADHLLSDHADRVAFANSVEGRYPFLDPEVVAFARDAPPSAMLRDGEEKHLLKQVGRALLPRELADRQKFSFVAPGSPELLRHGGDQIADLLSDSRIRRQGYFNPETVARLKARAARPGYRINQTFEDDPLMVVLTFGILLDRFALPDFT
jgi:asparagine synthase (glutamine-hydrolysing)